MQKSIEIKHLRKKNRRNYRDNLCLLELEGCDEVFD
jgi:hypothetical protein